MEDQVIEQSAVNPDMNSSESLSAPESQENSSSSTEETSFDAKEFSTLDENDQLSYLKNVGILGDESATKTPTTR